MIRGEPMHKVRPSKKKPELPLAFDPIYNGLLRSIKGHNNEWIPVIDMDCKQGLTGAMLEAAYAFYRAERTARRPVLKGSGKKGIQLYWRTKIENTATAPATMRDWIYTKYVELEIKDSYDISFGKDKDNPERAHIDILMFQSARMWRPFCTRLTKKKPNGRYSVPLSIGDDLETAQAKMNLDLRLTYEDNCDRGYITNLEKNIQHRFDIAAYQECDLPMSLVAPADALESRLTPMLRAIMQQEEPIREGRYALVSYMFCYMGIRDPEEIYNFIMERTKWKKKDPSTMRYQVRTSVDTCLARFPEKPVPKFVWRGQDGGSDSSD